LIEMMPTANQTNLDFRLLPRISFRDWVVLWIVVLVAVGLAMPSIKAEWDWQRFRSQVEAQGGFAERLDGGKDPKPWVVCRFLGVGRSKVDFSKLAWPAQVDELIIKNMELEDSDLKFLDDLKNLKRLELSSVSITDRAAETLRTLTQLRSVTLHHCRIGDDTVIALAELPHIGFLNVAGTYATEKSLDLLHQHSTLKSLILPSMDYARFNAFRAANPHINAKAISLPGTIPVPGGPPILYRRGQGLPIGPPPGPQAGAVTKP
jgi:hypothetical protein